MATLVIEDTENCMSQCRENRDGHGCTRHHRGRSRLGRRDLDPWRHWGQGRSRRLSINTSDGAVL